MSDASHDNRTRPWLLREGRRCRRRSPPPWSMRPAFAGGTRFTARATCRPPRSPARRRPAAADWTLTIVRTELGEEVITRMINDHTIIARPAQEDDKAMKFPRTLSIVSRRR